MSVDEILNTIPDGADGASEKKITEITVIKKAPTQKTVNTILIVAAAFIFIAVIASYFVDLDIFADITLKELSAGALWVFIGSFSIASIFKQISINRAKQTTEYIVQKRATQAVLEKYAESGELNCADEYCKAWEEKTLIADRERLLKPVGIVYSTYLEKYLAKSWRDLKSYPELSFKQRFAIVKANAVRIQEYNPDFLRTTVHANIRRSPSGRFDTDKRNLFHTVKTVVAMLGGSVFACSIANDLVLSFSLAALIEAGIKVAVIIISAAFATSFGWNLITVTEISRLKLQESEADACARWGKENAEMNSK